MPSRFTDAQRVEIIAQAHRHVADAKNTSSRFSPAERARIQAEARQHVAEAKAGARRDERTIVYKTAPARVQAAPPATGAAADSGQWEQWVDDRIMAMATAMAEEVVGRISDVRAEIERQAATQEREAALLRREFGVLRDEVGVEQGLRDLRTQVSKAQRSVPKVPTIEARLRAEATLTRADIDQEFASLGLKMAASSSTEHDLRQALLQGRIDLRVAELRLLAAWTAVKWRRMHGADYGRARPASSVGSVVFHGPVGQDPKASALSATALSILRSARRYRAGYHLRSC